MKKIRYIVFLIVFMLLLSTAAAADIVYLKNGNTYEGKIVKEDDEKIALKTSIMTVVFSKDEIEGIQRDYPSIESRTAAGTKFDVTDVLKDDAE
jgi:hypothetical protein